MSPSSAAKTSRIDPRAGCRCRREAGSALVMVMLMTAVLAGVAASLLLVTSSRYQTTFQSASWQEAIIGAESGVDLAMNELRKRVTQGPSASFQLNWTAKDA
ncbi:MAG: hypothetical protein INR62_00860, partial [Rhodospirillales bacterium]|nr:hypothetical protein [Acetobacter sp.]